MAMFGLTATVASTNSWIRIGSSQLLQIDAGLLWFQGCVLSKCEANVITKLGDKEEPVKTSGIVGFVLVVVSAVCQFLAFSLIVSRLSTSKWRRNTKKIDVSCNLLLLLAIACLFTSWIFYLIYTRNLKDWTYNYGLYMTIGTSAFSVIVIILTNLSVLKFKNKYIQL